MNLVCEGQPLSRGGGNLTTLPWNNRRLGKKGDKEPQGVFYKSLFSTHAGFCGCACCCFLSHRKGNFLFTDNLLHRAVQGNYHARLHASATKNQQLDSPRCKLLPTSDRVRSWTPPEELNTNVPVPKGEEI